MNPQDPGPLGARLKIDTVTVFCGSATGSDPSYAQTAHDLGNCLAKQGLRLVYGGASVGTMGILADAVLEAGGHVTGIIPRSLADREVAHPSLSRLRVVDSMLDRKEQMAQLADAYIVLPGGLGTLDELFEVLTATQLGLDPKPCGLLNHQGYWDGLLSFLRHVEHEGFARDVSRLFIVEDTSTALVDRITEIDPGTFPGVTNSE